MSTVQKIVMEDKRKETTLLKGENQSGKTSSVMQQASKINSSSLSYENIMQLQSTIGNRAVMQLLKKQSDDRREIKADVMGEQSDEVRLNNGTIVKDTCVQLAISQNSKKLVRRTVKASRVPKRSKKGRYGLGTYGFKKSEQKRAGTSGLTHQSEHTVGFEVINRTSGEKRRVGERAHRLENNAPAYQEVLKLHRDHIGTGTSGKPDASDFNSQSYRDAQRSLIENGDVSSAVQLNQLGYAFNPEFHGNDEELKIADDSFRVMVENMKEVQYAKNTVDERVLVSPEQRTEMYLSRKAARTGQWPTTDEIDEAKKKFGVDSNKDVTMGE